MPFMRLLFWLLGCVRMHAESFQTVFHYFSSRFELLANYKPNIVQLILFKSLFFFSSFLFHFFLTHSKCSFIVNRKNGQTHSDNCIIVVLYWIVFYVFEHFSNAFDARDVAQHITIEFNSQFLPSTNTIHLPIHIDFSIHRACEMLINCMVSISIQRIECECQWPFPNFCSHQLSEYL